MAAKEESDQTLELFDSPPRTECRSYHRVQKPATFDAVMTLQAAGYCFKI